MGLARKRGQTVTESVHQNLSVEPNIVDQWTPGAAVQVRDEERSDPKDPVELLRSSFRSEGLDVVEGRSIRLDACQPLFLGKNHEGNARGVNHPRIEPEEFRQEHGDRGPVRSPLPNRLVAHGFQDFQLIVGSAVPVGV